MEGALKELDGVLAVKGGLCENALGYAEVVFDPAKVSLERLAEALEAAGGERHRFRVVRTEARGGCEP